MSMHLQIDLKATGDPLTAISQAKKVVAGLGEAKDLYFPKLGPYGFSLTIHPDSYIPDLIAIYTERAKRVELEAKLQVAQLDPEFREEGGGA